MPVRLLGKSTFVVDNPAWNGQGFDDPDADRFWRRLPALLQRIALGEAERGNRVQMIQLERDRGTVLVHFSGPPRADRPSEPIRVHTSHEYGNYCYDDTVCTYENEGCFLSFPRSESSVAAG